MKNCHPSSRPSTSDAAGTDRALTEVVADTAWRRGGGRTPCRPSWPTQSRSSFSTFTTHRLLDDYNCSLDRVVEVIVAVLTAVINDQLDGRRRSTTKTANIR